MSDVELYRIPAKPTIYKGVPMKSALEAKTAAALERVGLRINIDFTYEPLRFADDQAVYTPDFHIGWIPIEGAPTFSGSEAFVEARPTMIDDRFRRKATQNANTLALSTDSPLIFVGLNEFPTALLGWCYGINPHQPVLGVIATRHNLQLDGHNEPPEPCLFVGIVANAWVDGFNTGRQN
jgi:hypothetical protein